MDVFHQFVYIVWEGWEMGSLTRETECTQEFSNWTHKDSGLTSMAYFGDWKYTKFLLISNSDLHTRSAKYHLFCNCDCVVRYNNIQRANANIAGNGDHINFAVALTKAYKSDNLELTVVNQNQVVTLSDVLDLHIKGLERNGSPNPNSMGYTLLPCLRDNRKSLWD